MYVQRRKGRKELAGRTRAPWPFRVIINKEELNTQQCVCLLERGHESAAENVLNTHFYHQLQCGAASKELKFSDTFVTILMFQYERTCEVL